MIHARGSIAVCPSPFSWHPDQKKDHKMVVSTDRVSDEQIFINLSKMVKEHLSEELAKQLQLLKKGSKLACGTEPSDYLDKNNPNRLFCPWEQEVKEPWF